MHKLKRRWFAKTPVIIKKVQRVMNAIHTSFTIGTVGGSAAGFIPSWVPLIPLTAGILSNFLLNLFTADDNHE